MSGGDPPIVSIAIRAHRKRWLGGAIESVLAQSFGDLELIVYDDAGDLEPLVRRFDDPRVRYHRAERQMQASGRFAAAVALCRGRYVGVLDDDDSYEPDFVARLVVALERDPEAGVAFCRCVWEADGELYPTVARLPAGRLRDSPRAQISARVSVEPSLMLIRREALDAAEDWQAMPDGVSPDRFVNVRIALTGWHHVVVDEVLVRRRWHPEQLTRAGRPSLDRSLVTAFSLRIDDPDLERVRRRRVGELLVACALSDLRAGDHRAARASLRKAARVDRRAAVRRRAVASLIAARGAGALLGPAYRLSARLERTRELPPGATGARAARGPRWA